MHRLSPLLLLCLLSACDDAADERSVDASTASDAATDSDATLDAAEPDSDATLDLDAGLDPDAAPDAGPVDPLAACRDDLVGEAPWPEAAEQVDLAGRVELGQTHVTDIEETRHAPVPMAERATLVLFTPDEAIPEGARLRLRAHHDGAALGTLDLQPGSPPILESGLTEESLEPYAPGAWHAQLPWQWAREGVQLEIGYLAEDTRHLHVAALNALSPPHRFTVNRTKMVLWGERDFDTTTQPAGRILRDFFGSVPVAELRWVDAAPWFVNEFVIRTADGPRMAPTEAERLAITDQEHHWFILKNQFTLRLSVANTGRGLVNTDGGDSSPYSFGTSVGMGWFRQPDGRYRDIDDAPWAAGWTGWTSMWTNECGNAFIHEVGHSLTLAHFTEGSAASWGIAEEYPQDGTNLATHPWGYDSTRRALRTWYRVTSEGPVREGGALVGKRDPMNGGADANAITCFPQYTGYHAAKAQAWMRDSPTLFNREGEPGAWIWNPELGDYEAAQIDPAHSWPLAIDVPIVTLIGTLGGPAEINQTYPPIYTPSGNVFDLPDPFGEGLPEAFTGARHYLEIDYEEGPTEHALIARGLVEDPDLALYSINLEAERVPTRVHLWRSATPYPDIVAEASERLHTREIGPSPEHARVLSMGRGRMGNGSLDLRQRCTEGFDCERHAEETTWRVGEGQLHFAEEAGPCRPEGDFTRLEVPVAEGSVVVHAQRVVRSGGHEFRVPLDDDTPWSAAADREQSLRAWVPYAPNADLAPGRHRGGLEQPVYLDGEVFDTIRIEVDLTVLERRPVDLAMEWVGPPVETPDSSINFLVRDPAVGPTSRVWWGDGEATPLRVQLRNEAGETAVLRLLAYNEICGGDRITFNAGRGVNNCPHRAVLFVDPEGNDGLAGGLWRTPPSSPLVIEARRWHDPDGQALLAVYALDLRLDRR